MNNHYDKFLQEAEPTERWQKIAKLVDPAYHRFHHRDYSEEVRIVATREIRVLTSYEEAQEDVPSPLD